MAARQTALFVFLLSIACSANAHEYGCKQIPGTRAVAISTFRFMPEDVRNEQKTHATRACPLADLGRNPRAQSTLRTLEAPAGQHAATRNVSLPPRDSDADKQPMCGVVDGDHYHHASAMIYRYCAKQAQTAGTARIGNAKKTVRGIAFKVTRPNSYNNAEHHNLYNFEDGNLVGACYVCVVEKPAAIGGSNHLPPPKE